MEDGGEAWAAALDMSSASLVLPPTIRANQHRHGCSSVSGLFLIVSFTMAAGNEKLHRKGQTASPGLRKKNRRLLSGEKAAGSRRFP